MQLDVRLPVLSDEIFSLIFDFLDDNGFVDRRTLLAFSLVSRRFRQWCQGLAIRRLELTTEHGPKRIRSLERATARNASIGPSVQILRINFHARFDKPRTNGLMVKFLSRLTNVRSFDFSIDSDDLTVYAPWCAISEPTRAALARIMTSPKLSTLTLTYVTFPLAQLLSYKGGLTNLQELTVFAVDSDHDPVEEFTGCDVASELSSDTTMVPISLRKLSICPGQGKVLLESSRIDWESVRTLRLMPLRPLFPQSGPELEECREMLARTKNLSKLENEEWPDNVTGQFDTLFSSVDIRFYTSLVHINLHLDWFRPRWRIGANGVGQMATGPGSWGFDHSEEPYMGLFTALSTFPSSNSLQTVRLCLILRFRNNEAAASAFNSTHWTRISSILAPERFPSLTLVYVGVRMPPLDHRPSVEAVTHELRGMPWGHLQESGKLKLEVLHAWS